MEGKRKKALTFSYDDGVTQDKRLISLFNKYGMKATFNLNSGLLGKPGELIREGVRISHNKVMPYEVAKIYEGHEVAVHTLTHQSLTKCSDEEVRRQVEEDRLNLSRFVGYEVVGMAYPNGSSYADERVERIIREETGVKYSRGTRCTGGFDMPKNLYHIEPTVYHLHFDEMMELGEKFVRLEPDEPKLFYVWGHAYEMDYDSLYWYRLEEFFKLISSRDDIFYGTNADVLL